MLSFPLYNSKKSIKSSRTALVYNSLQKLFLEALLIYMIMSRGRTALVQFITRAFLGSIADLYDYVMWKRMNGLTIKS